MNSHVKLDNFFDVGMFGLGLVCVTRIWNILGIAEEVIDEEYVWI